MPHAIIKTHQAKLTLLQLHAELAGKILDNQKEADRLRAAMQHVEAVIKLLDPTHSLRTIAVRRRKPNQWFKRGTVWRANKAIWRFNLCIIRARPPSDVLHDPSGIKIGSPIIVIIAIRNPANTVKTVTIISVKSWLFAAYGCV